MKCIICKDGITKKGMTSITLEREELLFVIKQVPAQVCSNCDEAYVEESVIEIVMNLAEKAYQEGIQLEVCQYKVA